MSDPTLRPVVAVFNSSDDMVELLRMMLENNGFVVVSGHIADLRRGKLDLQAFVTQNQPRAVVYDLVPPYDAQWAFLDHLRQVSPLRDVPFVITSTNAKMARELAGRTEQVIEILGRPFDMDELLKAVRRATE
jgi:DNA-binding NtrC family response regulator